MVRVPNEVLGIGTMKKEPYISPASTLIVALLMSIQTTREKYWGKENAELKIRIAFEILESPTVLDVSSLSAVLQRPRTSILRILKDWDEEGLCQLLSKGRRTEVYATEKLMNTVETFSAEIHAQLKSNQRFLS